MPARVKVRESPQLLERFGAKWTPTVLLLDPAGVERHRIEGFLPATDFAGQLLLGLGHAAFEAKDWKAAQRHFGEILKKLPDTDAAPEAQYWKGVSRYKETNDATALTETFEAFQKRYRDSPWAKKASVWGPAA